MPSVLITHMCNAKLSLHDLHISKQTRANSIMKSTQWKHEMMTIFEPYVPCLDSNFNFFKHIPIDSRRFFKRKEMGTLI